MPLVNTLMFFSKLNTLKYLYSYVFIPKFNTNPLKSFFSIFFIVNSTNKCLVLQYSM